jgi:bifunctional non-homologous end joining protein LigD
MPLPRGFIAPCLPTKALQPPSGDAWLHEIKHDGFRVIARKDGDRVRLYSRLGNDLTYRFPLIVEALTRLRSRSYIIDVLVTATAGRASTASATGSMRAYCCTYPRACTCSRNQATA